jgi:glutaredoxin
LQNASSKLARRMVAGWMTTLLVASALPGCSRRERDASDAEPREASALTFTKDTPGLLLTWIDPAGGTHVVERPSEVPADAKRLVRVLMGDSDRGQFDPILVSDLGAGDSASFVAKPVPRKLWEDEIAKRREGRAAAGDAEKKRVPRDAAPPSGAPGAGSDPPAPLDERARNLEVVIYGASWCKPCHDALHHLEKLGIRAQFRDIEKEPAAAVEMRKKLERAGRGGGSIPVIDVAGRLLVGYAPRALDAAIAQAAKGTPL